MFARAFGVVALLSVAACQQAVAPGGAIVSGETAGITSVTVDGEHVYFTTHDAVKRAPLAGGEIEVLASAQHEPKGVVVDGDHAFWIATGGVFRAPKAGGDVVEAAAGDNIGAITLDASHIFLSATSQDALLVVDKTGGVATALVSNVVGVDQIAPLAGATLFFSDAADGVLEVSPSGGEATPVVKSTVPYRLASSEPNLYYTTIGDRAIVRVDAEGTVTTLASPETVADPSANPTSDPEGTMTQVAVPREIVADELDVYWTSDDGALNMVDAEGLGAPQVLASSVLPQSVHLTSDAAFLYIANEADGAIFAIPKPVPSF